MKKKKKKKWLNDFAKRNHEFDKVIKHCKPLVITYKPKDDAEI